MDFPSLIRFNPNIPWKTRGNGAVRLTIKTKNPKKIKNKITQFVASYSDTKNGANPGLVFYQNEKIPVSFHKFSKLALWKLISRKQAKQFVSEKQYRIILSWKWSRISWCYQCSRLQIFLTTHLSYYVIEKNHSSGKKETSVMTV